MGRDPKNRGLLQKPGSRLVGSSAMKVSRDLLGKIKWKRGDGPLGVDGVRHKEVLEAMREIVASLPGYIVGAEAHAQIFSVIYTFTGHGNPPSGCGTVWMIKP